jgi:hypothetical protein
VQAGIVGLRGAITAAWEEDLRAVRQDRYDTGADKEALVFIQRCYSLVSDLRAPIQKAWGPGGHVHVADSPDVSGPGPRVSQTRIKLRNRGEIVSVEGFTYANGAAKHSPGLGLDREIKTTGAGPLRFVQEVYRLTIDFLQVALNLDLGLAGSAWLYEQVVANDFVVTGRWPAVGDVYQRATREFAVEDSFERVAALLGPGAGSNGTNGTNGTNGADGAQWYFGSAAPSTLHNNGDIYFRTTGAIYKQVAGAWVDQSNPTKQMLAAWSGTMPAAIGAGVVWKVPKVSGATATFLLGFAIARVELTPIGSSAQFVLEKSAGGGAFSGAPTTVSTLTIAPAGYEASDTGVALSVSTGDLLRLRFAALGGLAGACGYSIELQGAETA